MFKLADIVTPLQEHQARVVRRIQGQPGLVVAHGMGSGKTLTSIAAAEALGGRAAAVVPSALQANYNKELKKHVHGKRNAQYTVSSIQKAVRDGYVPKSDLLIVDEAHRIRDPGSKSKKVVAEAQAAKRLLLTGTPLYNRPHDLAALVNVAAGDKIFPSEQAEFEKQYIGETLTNPSLFARVFRGIEPGATPTLRNKEDLKAKLQKWVDYHENAQTDFPERRNETITATMSPKQREVYDTVMGRAPAWVRYKVREGLPPSKQEAKSLNAFLTAARGVSTSPGGFDTRMGAGEAAAASPKIQAAFGRLQAAMALNPKHRALIYSNFLEGGIDPYEDLLHSKKIPYAKFTGPTSKKLREQAIQDYNSGKLPVLMVSSAGGEGLDLKGTRQIQILDPHWNKEKLEQVIARGIRYKSHSDMPEDQRNVNVEQYLSTLPEPGAVSKFFGSKRPGSVDEYLTAMSTRKDLLNQQVRELLKDRPKAASLRAEGGPDVTKLSAIEPDVFRGFAKEVLQASKGEDPGAIDEYDSNAPFRSGNLRGNQEADRQRSSADKVPREDYGRETKLKQAAVSPLERIGRALSLTTARDYQDQLEDRYDHNAVIPGSRHVVKGGIPMHPHRRGH